MTTTTILTNQDEDLPAWSRLSLTSLRNSDQVNTFGRLKKSEHTGTSVICELNDDVRRPKKNHKIVLFHDGG